MVKKNYGNILSRFHAVRERYGRTDVETDRRTDRQKSYINTARSMLKRDKNCNVFK